MLTHKLSQLRIMKNHCAKFTQKNATSWEIVIFPELRKNYANYAKLRKITQAPKITQFSHSLLHIPIVHKPHQPIVHPLKLHNCPVAPVPPFC